MQGAHLLNPRALLGRTLKPPRPALGSSLRDTKAGRGLGLTDKHQQSSPHGGAMRKAELQQDLVGHGHRQGPSQGRQQAQRPHGHVAAVFWESNHSRAEHTARTAFLHCRCVFKHSVMFTDPKVQVCKTRDHIRNGVCKLQVKALTSAVRRQSLALNKHGNNA